MQPFLSLFIPFSLHFFLVFISSLLCLSSPPLFFWHFLPISVIPFLLLFCPLVFMSPVPQLSFSPSHPTSLASSFLFRFHVLSSTSPQWPFFSTYSCLRYFTNLNLNLNISQTSFFPLSYISPHFFPFSSLPSPCPHFPFLSIHVSSLTSPCLSSSHLLTSLSLSLPWLLLLLLT